jgi:uncharacterized RDD family membrane protein YckC
MWVPFGFGVAGLGLFAAVTAVAYPVFVVWMIIDALLRTDAEYPGTEANRKILWVVLMILFHLVSIAYFFVVFLKIKRGSFQAPQYPPPAA